MARRGRVYLGQHGRSLHKESVCKKMIRKNFLNKAAKNSFSLGSVFLVDLQLSVWIIQYSNIYLNCFFFKYYLY